MAVDAVCVVTILIAQCNCLAILGAENSFVLCGKLLFMNNTEK